MAVMNKMRANMHIILFFLLVMFVASMTIGGLVGGANIMDILSGRKPDTILVVNGEEVSYEQFSRAYNGELEAYRQRNNKEPEGYQVQQIENQVWESLIQDILKRQMIEELGLSATTEEIRYYLFTNPHPYLRMNPNFQNENNEFDPQKLQAALASPGNDQFWKFVEDYLRILIPMEKLENEVLSTVRLTEAELKQEYIRRNQKMKVSYISFDPNEYIIPDDQITEKDVEEYYKEHIEEYKEVEKRKIRYVLFPTTPSSQDSAEVEEFARTMLDSARAGADFAELAITYSDDLGSAENGGDLGYFGKGAMVKPFEEAAFAAEAGEVVGPVKSNFGIHIIKVEDKRTENGEEQVKARHILLKYKASRRTQEEAKQNADYFAENVDEEGFDALAEVENLKIDTTDYFTDTGFIPGIGMNKRISMSAFNTGEGNTSRVYLVDDKGYLVYQLIDIQEEGTKPLEEVKQIITSRVRREKQFEKAKQVATAIRERIQMPEDMERVAASDSLEIKTTDFFSLDGSIPGIGRDVNFNGTAFSLSEKEVSAPVEGAAGYYIIRLEEKQEFDESDFNLAKDNLRQQKLDEKRRAVYTAWISSMKEQADIKDYRYMFY
ncbi:hypothetical protein GF337_15210 [candidate division KSB1 bacterium]|nr:hypothetical protein [candidate division KSB1 bacterium]